ncbi:3-keto-disaccharide hydrolase [Kriegella aquimaris]|uniref:3-keto-alpha-glucoside-1,2-lyase/3-keto-2-hydroxy-glucal hydratase domain-containing protein n=1 Tax=Kriegella aquimaris TaxID=192904 RepID=A0A1G9WVQ6_9FLAO|nr:DUF1080 domain-containing protein [Kriegella aquimaris]SDM88560.1 protein of unknown function [Kriegella aquimaris]
MKQLIFILSFSLYMGFAFAQESKSLFNGKDLSGWTKHGTEYWYVDNGELVCESGPDEKYGYLSTNKPYKNFILDLDFKLEANGNSGIFIRSQLGGPDDTTIKGWQVEVAPPDMHTGGIYESIKDGRGWVIKPDPKDEKHLDASNWNHMRIEAKDDIIVTWLNGKQMVKLKDEKIGEGQGSIALQIHSGGGIKVRWKNIKIQEIE